MAVAGVRLHRQVEGPPLEPLVQQEVSRAVPDQKLDPVASTVDEDKEMAVQWILVNETARGRSQPVKAPAQVHGLSGDVDPNRRGQRQHVAASSSTTSTRRRSSVSKPRGTRTRRPPASWISIGAPPPVSGGLSTSLTGWKRSDPSPTPDSRLTQRASRRGSTPWRLANPENVSPLLRQASTKTRASASLQYLRSATCRTPAFLAIGSSFLARPRARGAWPSRGHGGNMGRADAYLHKAGVVGVLPLTAMVAGAQVSAEGRGATGL